MGKLCLRPKIVGAIGYVVLPNPYEMGVRELQVCRNCKKVDFSGLTCGRWIKISLDIKDNV